MKYNPITRRLFLEGLGKVTLSLPLLPSLLPEAYAQVAAPSKRFIGIGCPYGVYPEWYPSLEANAAIAPGVYSANLNAINGDISKIFTSSYFSDLKSKILFIRGLDQCHFTGHNANAVFGAGHNTQGFSEGGFSQPTIDHILSRSSVIYPSPPKLRSLILAPDPLGKSSSTYSIAKTSSGLKGVEGIGNAKAAFDLAFSGAIATPPPQASGISTSEKKKIVDKVYQDYLRVRSGRAISAQDKKRLEDHMSYLSDIQSQLGEVHEPAPVSCGQPQLAATAAMSKSDFDKAIKNHLDIVVAALACGSTRIAMLMFSEAFHRVMFGNSDYHGQVSHSTTNLSGFLAVQGSMAKHISYLLRKLDSIADYDGRSLLYHSIVLWGNSLNVGGHHTSYNLPIFMAGNGGGEISTGRILDYRQRPFVAPSKAKNQQIGRPYNQLLVSIMQIMGLHPADYEQNGEPGFGTYDQGVVPEVGVLHAPFKTASVKRSRLPGLKV